MSLTKALCVLSLIVLAGMILTAAGSGASSLRDSRPRQVQAGAVISSVDQNSGTVKPLRYVVLEVDGAWLNLQLLKKKKQERKGKPFWMKVDALGAFTIE